MINETQLKHDAWATAMGLPNVNQSSEILQSLLNQNDTHVIQWTAHPGQPGILCFRGTSKDFQVLAVQANIRGDGVIHRGTAIASDGPLVIILPPSIAYYLYHYAAAQHN